MDASPGNRADHPQQHALSVIADMPVGEIQTCVTDDETPWSTGVPSGLRESQALTSDADPAAAGRASVATTAQSSGRRSGNVDGSDGVVAVRQREVDVDDAGPGECVAHPEFAIAGVRGRELVPGS